MSLDFLSWTPCFSHTELSVSGKWLLSLILWALLPLCFPASPTSPRCFPLSQPLFHPMAFVCFCLSSPLPCKLWRQSESEVAQSCLTLRNPKDCSPLGSSVHGIFQARVLNWGAIALSERPPKCSQLSDSSQGPAEPSWLTDSWEIVNGDCFGYEFRSGLPCSNR